MERDQPLFDPADLPAASPKTAGHTFAPLQYPLWTEHKANLIARYLYFFVLITKHGTYIDGFSGPQNDRPEMWAAKLVLESQPPWLKHFHLVELDERKIADLKQLKTAEAEAHTKPKRSVNIYHGDFNIEVKAILASGVIKPKEAAFCLLDQRTFECHWKTLVTLASYKPAGEHKIELFYFLPIGWLGRAFAATTKNESSIVDWWGRADWRVLQGLSNHERSSAFADRMKNELGYASVTPWPIYEKKDSSKVMYYMIHATDHPEAPKLMHRAYRRAVDPVEPMKQLELAWNSGTIET